MATSTFTTTSNPPQYRAYITFGDDYAQQISTSAQTSVRDVDQEAREMIAQLPAGTEYDVVIEIV